MNDEQLSRNLQSIGQSCFVKYYDLFSSRNVNRTEIIEKLKAENGYTEKSCISRTSHALAVINAGRSIDALNIIASSDSPKVSKETREIANTYISNAIK